MPTGSGQWPNLNILGAVHFASGFANADSLGMLQAHYLSITGASFVTGAKYSASMNGCISSLGGGGPNYFPGDTAGVVQTGGQYQ